MKLKRLELIGFKSFVDPTVISFEKDITGVVGPNGCGKSNIVDAIRWVMGEQSPKHLRGKSMEDVIFAGSEARSSLSMASVELTFSTEGYQTPAAYLNHPEISICRRVYRSGESEYFINKAPVRLKDIHELFLGTGVGTKAYSIIEQGKVTQFLTAKPEERRYYIEEAAGISKFKHRKEAALRKMEATRQNLLRLTDLITELERQINSLDRQAKKAEKYKEIKTEYQKWDLSLAAFNYQTAQTQQESLEKELRHWGEQELNLKTELSGAEIQLETARLSLMEQEKEINATQTSLFDSTNTVQIAETNLKYKKEEITRIEGQGLNLESEIEGLLIEIAKTESALTAANENKMLADLDRQHLEEEIESLELVVTTAQTKADDMRLTIERLQSDIHSSQNRLAQIAAIRESQIQKQADLSHDVTEWTEVLEKKNRLHTETQKIYREASESLSSLKQMKLSLTEQTDQLGQELGTLRETLKKEEKELAELKENLTLRKSRLSSLEQLQKNFEGYQEGTRSVLLRKQQQGGEGIFGTVADFVETTPEYEGAVSAVLGEKLQYVVVKTQAEGLEAVEYLKTASTGRSSFIPMALRTYGDGDDVFPQREGVLGPLKNFVSVRDDYSQLADFLFGDVVLVEDLKKALDIWGANGHRKTLVTLNGEVVDPTGIITGGNMQDNANTLLAMKREIKDLSRWVVELENEWKEKEVRHLQLVKHADELNRSLESVKHSSYAEEVRIANQGKDVDQIRKDLELLEQSRQELSGKITEAQAELTALASSAESLKTEEENLHQKEIQAKADGERAKAELEELLSSFESQSVDLTRLKVERAQAVERQNRLEADLNRLSEEKERLRSQMSRNGEEREVLEGRRVLLEKDVAHLTKVISKKLEQRDQLQQQYTTQREAYEQGGETIRSAELSLKELRHTTEEASRQLNQVTIVLSEVRSQLKLTIEQCLERHQLSLSDVYTQYLNPELSVEEASARSAELREKLSRMGEVNTGALAEYEELKVRYDFLQTQSNDLSSSLEALDKVIQKINHTTKEKFESTFHLVDEKFQNLFPKLFRGGRAKLVLTDESNILESGIDIVAQPPGKKLQSITLLSGGEKALTAVSLIFSIFQIKPSPFCILDEVDAPLDEANVGRYNELLRDMTERTQFIVITHNKKTMSAADTLYGVTMQEAGVSRLVSVDLK